MISNTYRFNFERSYYHLWVNFVILQFDNILLPTIVPIKSGANYEEIDISKSMEAYWKHTIYFPIIGTIINNLKFPFSNNENEYGFINA